MTAKFSRILVLVTLLAIGGCGVDQAPEPMLYPEAGSVAANLYVSKCSDCHAAPLPSVHTAEHWPGVIHRMQFRMTSKHVAPLTAEELPIIIEYLQRHAKS